MSPRPIAHPVDKLWTNIGLGQTLDTGWTWINEPNAHSLPNGQTLDKYWTWTNTGQNLYFIKAMSKPRCRTLLTKFSFIIRMNTSMKRHLTKLCTMQFGYYTLHVVTHSGIENKHKCQGARGPPPARLKPRNKHLCQCARGLPEAHPRPAQHLPNTHQVHVACPHSKQGTQT